MRNYVSLWEDNSGFIGKIQQKILFWRKLGARFVLLRSFGGGVQAYSWPGRNSRPAGFPSDIFSRL